MTSYSPPPIDLRSDTCIMFGKLAPHVIGLEVIKTCFATVQRYIIQYTHLQTAKVDDRFVIDLIEMHITKIKKIEIQM